MKKFLQLLFLSSSIFLSSCDCVQFVTGSVIDHETKQPISGVKVYKQGMAHDNSLTDEKGEFEINSISGGLFGCPEMRIVIEKEGYETVEHRGSGTIELKKK